MEKPKTIGVALILIGLFIMVHHYVLWQRIVDLEDILHHEFLEAILLTAGTTLLISNHYKKTRSCKT